MKSERPGADPSPVSTDAAGAVVVAIRVIPRARQTCVDGVRHQAVLVRLAAPPVDGAANHELIEFLARRLDCPRRAIQLVAGQASRDKRVRIDGMRAQDVAARLLTANA
jgi:hypothetical protein